jgi:aminoglycoside phosphotransferase (APT) family kinase protein
MNEDTRGQLEASVIDRAAEHGLRLAAGSLRIEEAGLDFRVVFARDLSGREWVIRTPRRDGLVEAMAREARILTFLRPRLPVALPDWQIHAPTMIAYPRLPGRPGLTLDPGTGAPLWHIVPDSAAYAEALGRLIAALHAIDPEQARAAGLPGGSVAAERAAWRLKVAEVKAAFAVATTRQRAWQAWLDDDAHWPEPAVVTHGELYPAHVLVDEELAIRGVLDWTTAQIGDPAVDFAFQHRMGEAAFSGTVQAYMRAGGRELAHLSERCAARAAADAAAYGVFALASGAPQHIEAARAMLAADPEAT